MPGGAGRRRDVARQKPPVIYRLCLPCHAPHGATARHSSRAPDPTAPPRQQQQAIFSVQQTVQQRPLTTVPVIQHEAVGPATSATKLDTRPPGPPAWQRSHSCRPPDRLPCLPQRHSLSWPEPATGQSRAMHGSDEWLPGHPSPASAYPSKPDQIVIDASNQAPHAHHWQPPPRTRDLSANSAQPLD